VTSRITVEIGEQLLCDFPDFGGRQARLAEDTTPQRLEPPPQRSLSLVGAQGNRSV
jgi:hypothetical protein